MRNLDIDHVAALFAIIEGCVSHTGKFAAIQSAAFNELTEINASLRQQQMERKAQADTEAQEQARAQAAVDAQQQEGAEEEEEEEEEAATDEDGEAEDTLTDPVRRA